MGEMDDIDRNLMIFITRDPRASYQELAKRLGISRQAVQRRMQSFIYVFSDALRNGASYG